MKSIIFCSSQRNAPLLNEFIALLRLTTPAGKSLIIYEPRFDQDELAANLRNLPESERLKDLSYRATVVKKVLEHNNLIRIADVCFIFNPQNGYIGNNTHAELVAAAVLGKHIFAYHKPIMMGKWPDQLYEEPSATAYVVNDPVSDPSELIKYLV